MTHDYLHNGIATLFAAFNILDRTVLGRCMHRHRHQELLRFLNAIEGAVPVGKVIHVILDNYRSHKAMNWLTRHPRWTFHFTSTPGPWLNAVETFFSTLTRRRLKRGTFHSAVHLHAAIHRYISRAQRRAQAFPWTKTTNHPRQTDPLASRVDILVSPPLFVSLEEFPAALWTGVVTGWLMQGQLASQMIRPVRLPPPSALSGPGQDCSVVAPSLIAEALDEADVAFLGAFGGAWGDAMAARWSTRSPRRATGHRCRPAVIIAVG